MEEEEGEGGEEGEADSTCGWESRIKALRLREVDEGRVCGV